MEDTGLGMEGKSNGNSRAQRLFRIAVFILLAAGILIEGYYIFVIRNKINRELEESGNIAVHLQTLKNHRDYLNSRLSSVKKPASEEKDGNSPDR